jgi:hypothetical protein
MKITAYHVRSAADAVGGEFTDSYSGRGMYGDTCVGITMGYADRESIAENIATQIIEEDEDYSYLLDDYDEDEFNEVRDEIAAEEIMPRISQDSMGLGVIYYFRSVKV